MRLQLSWLEDFSKLQYFVQSIFLNAHLISSIEFLNNLEGGVSDAIAIILITVF